MKTFEIWYKSIRETISAQSAIEACIKFERKYRLDSCTADYREVVAEHPAIYFGRNPSAEYIEAALKGYVYELPINIYTGLPD
jgi:hypothetical protein